MLYEDKRSLPISEEDFRNPPAIYRGTPFWAWNCKMTKAKIKKVLQEFRRMGMGGAYFHSRTGMDMPYLGAEFMEMIRYAHEEANKLGLSACLYDEDRWPSGTAGGMVTSDKKFRSRFLVFSPKILPPGEKAELFEAEASAAAVSSGERKFLASYDVKLDDGWLVRYRRNDVESDESAEDGYRRWYAYLEVGGDNPWFNNQAYVDTLNPEAIRAFIKTTYEVYEKELGNDFGKGIPMIFTDEPQFSFKTQFGYAEEVKCQTIPYTDDFEETYRQTYQDSFLDYLPEIFWDLPEGQISVHRYRYHDHLCQRFTESYADQIGKWCKEKGILLTGHMMREPFLEWQTMALGEAMRSYRSFGIPGMDMLCDRRELTTAKQVQSAVHQFHAPGMTSEMYGVTGWDFDFRGHKLAGDWQAALGVTCRTHHLTWTSMAGEAKRDYPASIGSQSPWYLEYPYIEDYFARLNVVLTRGEPIVKVGVIHPIESYWLYWGTKEKTDGIRREREENFVNLVRWLLYGQIDFDFISESLLVDFRQDAEYGFQAGYMNYDVIVVPDCITLRRNTLLRLQNFVNRGGRVIFLGRVPKYIDAEKSEECVVLAEKSQVIRYSEDAVLEALEPERLIDIRNQTGARAGNLLYQFRQEKEQRWLFIAHSEKPKNPDLALKEELLIRIRGTWKVERWNPLDGSREWIQATQKSRYTEWYEDSYDYDSFLYRLIPETESNGNAVNTQRKSIRELSSGQVKVPAFMPVELEEENVLVLDRAEYCFDDDEWRQEEDILRIDNQIREFLGYPLRTEALAQPWVETQDMQKRNCNKHKLNLRFRIQAECMIERVCIALEETAVTQIWWNGRRVTESSCGYYVDDAIQKIPLGHIHKGENVLECQIEYDGKTSVENMYLLGDFGVGVAGRTAWVTKPVRKLAFGDICSQGLPFYGGNLTYYMDVCVKEDIKNMELRFSKFRCSVIRGEWDQKEQGLIAYAPYKLELGDVKKGEHRISLKMYGNRANTFGTVHNCNQTEEWIGPNAWRSTGNSWSDEYQLKPTGILVSPKFYYDE